MNAEIFPGGLAKHREVSHNLASLLLTNTTLRSDSRKEYSSLTTNSQ
jgi:hypothetical protein